MRVGIVGSEEAKFTLAGRTAAQTIIVGLIEGAEAVVSGGCHLGGIDIWAKEIGLACGLVVWECLPQKRSWSGGYKERNLEIAQYSDVVYCITVDRLPPEYSGMRFPMCYHCNSKSHIKSGGCWTVKQALRMGKEGCVLVVENV